VAPAFVVELCSEALRQFGGNADIRDIADRTWLAGRAAIARARAILPWPIRMGLANPAGVGAVRAEAHAILSLKPPQARGAVCRGSPNGRHPGRKTESPDYESDGGGMFRAG
jgi:hypothetical protein